MISDVNATRSQEVSIIAWPGLSTELQKYVPKNICNGSADICSASADWVYKSVSATRLLLCVYFDFYNIHAECYPKIYVLNEYQKK